MGKDGEPQVWDPIAGASGGGSWSAFSSDDVARISLSKTAKHVASVVAGHFSEGRDQPFQLDPRGTGALGSDIDVELKFRLWVAIAVNDAALGEWVGCLLSQRSHVERYYERSSVFLRDSGQVGHPPPSPRRPTTPPRAPQ